MMMQCFISMGVSSIFWSGALHLGHLRQKADVFQKIGQQNTGIPLFLEVSFKTVSYLSCHLSPNLPKGLSLHTRSFFFPSCFCCYATKKSFLLFWMSLIYPPGPKVNSLKNEDGFTSKITKPTIHTSMPWGFCCRENFSREKKTSWWGGGTEGPWTVTNFVRKSSEVSDWIFTLLCRNLGICG